MATIEMDGWPWLVLLVLVCAALGWMLLYRLRPRLLIRDAVATRTTAGKESSVTEHAVLAIAQARREAVRLGSQTLDPRHLLLGILKTEVSGSAVESILAGLRVSPGDLTRGLEMSLQAEPPVAREGEPVESKTFRAAIDAAYKEAAAVPVDSEHLLIGALEHLPPELRPILAGAGVTSGRARAALQSSILPETSVRCGACGREANVHWTSVAAGTGQLGVRVEHLCGACAARRSSQQGRE